MDGFQCSGLGLRLGFLVSHPSAMKLRKDGVPSDHRLILFLSADDDYGEAAGEDGWARPGILRRGVGTGAEVGGDQVDAVGG